MKRMNHADVLKKKVLDRQKNMHKGPEEGVILRDSRMAGGKWLRVSTMSYRCSGIKGANGKNRKAT